VSSKRIKRIIASRKLTAEEAAEARRLRELAESDRPEITAQGRELLAEKRRREAAARGTTTLGQKLRAVREARGLSQADLAARARVEQDYLSHLEQDHREPSLSIAARIARELDIPLDELASAATS
jgi:DNA-binding XRE family transcriptional regulator